MLVTCVVSLILMLFVDRLYLSHHSLRSLNAAVHAGTIAWAFISFFGYLVAICEVYVAQRNGAKEHQLLGQPVWQMLWTCLFLIPVLGCIAYWIPSLLFTHLEASEKIYFSYTLFWGGVPFCFLSALNAFYIGRGRTNIVTWLSILANLINIVLDPVPICNKGLL